METTLSKIEEQGITIAPAFNGVFVKGKTIPARAWLAGKFGVTLAKGSTFKTVKEAILAKGNTPAALKAAQKEYSANMADYYRASGLSGAMIVADPTFRKALKMRMNKDGQPTGSFTIDCRPVVGPVATGPSARELALEKQLAELTLRLAALPA